MVCIVKLGKKAEVGKSGHWTASIHPSVSM